MKQPDTSALRERLAGYTSEQDIQELDGLTEKINGQINGLHNLLDEIKDLREEMHGIHESLRHTLQRERTAFNALTAAKDSAENIVDGISNAIVKAEQHTVIKAEVSTAELEKINQWSAAHIKAEEEIWTRQSKKLARYLSKNEGIWLSSRWLIFMIIVQAVSYFAVIFWAIFCNFFPLAYIHDNCTSRLILCRNILGNILQTLTLYVQMHEAPGTAEGFFFHFSITADTTVILRLFSVSGGIFPVRRFIFPPMSAALR